MKFKIFIFITAFLFILTLFSAAHANAKEPDPSPKALIEETIYEFAPVIAGTIVSHSFKVKNTGDATLNIPGIYSE